MHPLRPGDPEQIGEYAILGRLDEGPRGDVYVGKETGDDAPVRVIKLLAAEPGSGQAVLDRLTVATRVSSSYVARTITAGLLGDRPYVVREHVEGRSLAAAVAAEGPLSGEALERVAVGVLTALTAVHLADLAHGSLTPHNVIVADDGVKLTDVAAGPPSGEPAYRAPEQIRGERYDAYADMFAWAATVVFAATGRPPFPQEPQAVLNAQPDLGGLEERLRQVVLPALAKEPGQRPTAYTAMLQLLGGGAAGAQPSAGPGTAVVLPAQPPQPLVGGVPVPPAPQQTWGPPPVPQQPQQAPTAAWQPPAMPQEQTQQQTWGPPTTQGQVETPRRKPFPVGLAAAVGAVVLLSGVGLWGAGHYTEVQLSPAAAERAAGQHGTGGRLIADAGNVGGGTTGGATGGGGQAPTPAPQVTVPWALSSDDPDSPVEPLVLPSEWPTDAPVTPELTSVPTPGPIVPVPTQPVVPPPAQPTGQTTQPTVRVTTTATVTAQPSPVPTEPTPEPPPTQSPSPTATERQEQVPSPQPTAPSEEPTGKPTGKPTERPDERPSWVPSWVPTEKPTVRPTEEPTAPARPSPSKAPVPTTQAPKPSTPAPKPTTVAPKPSTPAPKPTTVAPKPSTPAPKPTTAAPVRNPYGPVRVCGAGFSVQRSSPMAGGTAYQLYNPGTGENCVVTIKTADVGKATPVSATLEVQGGGSRTDSGNYEYYAGPVKLQAKGKCVRYSGRVGSAGASSDWGNCG
ncbi:serine/threonine-protein kinase [Microbispora sp. KK1-11]|uniref:serine/threonine protein kinase n=1 Tax=Microbispora sp. KK1-11 TaxID=2053005 RepID=UPI00163C001E|nr:serine/threonine-protein kinase [Microbispora sp. KK1-11]